MTSESPLTVGQGSPDAYFVCGRAAQHGRAVRRQRLLPPGTAGPQASSLARAACAPPLVARRACLASGSLRQPMARRDAAVSLSLSRVNAGSYFWSWCNESDDVGERVPAPFMVCQARENRKFGISLRIGAH